jgi:hypothetical protein
MWQLGSERIVGNLETIPLIQCSRKTGFSATTTRYSVNLPKCRLFGAQRTMVSGLLVREKDFP